MNSNTRISKLSAISSGIFFAAFLLLAFVFNGHYEIVDPLSSLKVGLRLRWLVLPCIVVAVVSLVPLFASLFLFLASQGKLSERMAKRVHESQFVRWATRPQSSPSRKAPFALVLAVAVTCILLFVGLLHRWGILEEDRLNGQMYDVLSAIRGYDYRTGTLSGIVRGSLYPENDDVEQFAKDLTETVARLRNAGAIAILVPEAEAPRSMIIGLMTRHNEVQRSLLPPDRIEGSRATKITYHAQSVPGQANKDLLAFRRFLASTRISVLYSTVGIIQNLRDSTGEIAVPQGTFATGTISLRPGGSLLKVPLFRGSGSWYVGTDHDVLVPLLQIMASTRDVSAQGSTSPAAQSIGVKIPQSNGSYFSRDRFPERLPFDFFVLREIRNGTRSQAGQDDLLFSPATARPPKKGEAPESLSSERLKEMVQGKCVLLSSSLGWNGPESPTLRAYAAALQNLLDGKTLTKSVGSYLWVSLILLIASALIASLVRPLLASLSILLLVITFLWISSLTYDHSGVYLDLVSPLLSLAIAAWAFPLLRYVSKQQASFPA